MVPYHAASSSLSFLARHILGHIKNYLNTDKEKENAPDQKVPLKDQVYRGAVFSERATVVCFMF